MTDKPAHEQVGAGYDPCAVGYELQGRASRPVVRAVTPLERAEQAARIAMHAATDRERETAKRVARAVIAAIREPSEAQIDATGEALIQPRDLRFSYGNIYRAMIDQLLEGE